MDPRSAGALQCVVVTPERAVLDTPADFVALPLYDGELGVLPGRLPLIGRLGTGELRVRYGDRVRRFYLDGGFAQVRANTVTVLTSRAVSAGEINEQAAQQVLAEPLHVAPTPEAEQAEHKKREAARAQLRVASHERGQTTL